MTSSPSPSARAAAAVAAYDADVALVRELRMGLREVTTRLLTERRWRAFAEPVTPDDDPEYWHRVRAGNCSQAWLMCHSPHGGPRLCMLLGLMQAI